MEKNQELVGWDGKIAPAPVDWDTRPYFRDEQSIMTIQNWNTATTEALRAYPVAHQPFVDLSSKLEVAPRYWAPNKAELDDLGPSWGHFLLLPPNPIDPSDLHSAAPYWWRYTSRDGWLLVPPTEPQERGINVEEEGKEATKRRAADHGSTKAIERYQRRLQARAEEQLARLAVEAVVETVEAPAPDIIHMKVEVFIRPAVSTDSVEISNILRSYDGLTCYPACSEMTAHSASS